MTEDETQQLGRAVTEIAAEGDLEFWRLERLELFRQILRFHQLDESVARLFDGKGGLTVTWKTPPTIQQQEQISDLWETVFDERPVNHCVEQK